MKYLKYFKTEAAYDSYKNGIDFIIPNVSYTVDSNTVFYNSTPSLTYNMIDLGLPSGLLWADRNVGASSPEDDGLYFQWGDKVGYTTEQIANGEKSFELDWSNYFDVVETNGYQKFNKYDTNKLTVLESSDDAATINMGSTYRMPTKTEIEELINNTTATFIDLQGNEYSKSEVQSGAISEYNLNGVKFTGANGNSIFIPATGGAVYSTVNAVYIAGFIWSSNLNTAVDSSASAHALYFDNTGSIISAGNYRYVGATIRGVKSK